MTSNRSDPLSRGSHVLLIGIYLNLKRSLLGRPYYYPAFHKRMMGAGKSLLQVSQQTPPVGPGGRISPSIHSEGEGSLPA